MLSRFTHRRRFGCREPVAAGCLALLLSCGSPLASDEHHVSRIDVSIATVELGVGQTRSVVARVFDDRGREIAASQVFWSSENSAVASVTQQGQITAVGLGTTRIAASAAGVSSLVTVTVSARPVAQVQVHPSGPQVIAGATVQLAAEAMDGNGDVIGGRTFTWLTSNAAIATVDGDGLVTGVAVGSTTIHALTGGVEGSTTVTVLPVPIVPVARIVVSPDPAVVHAGSSYARTFTAATLDAQGSALTGRSVSWSSLNPLVATVSPLGAVTGVAAGTTRIRAASEGVEGFADVTVDLVGISTVDVTPSSTTLSPTQTATLQATPRDSAGSVVTGTALGSRGTTWTTSAASIATVSPLGVVTAVGQGTAAITATIDGTGGSASITVLAAVGGLVISLPGDSIIGAGTLAGTVTLTDANQQPLPGRGVTISSGTPTVATVTPASATTDGSGQVAITVTGVAPGMSSVSATSGGQSTAQTVRVLSPVQSVTVSAPADSVIGTGTVQATAALFDASNNPLSGRVVAWSSSDPSVASVDAATGLVTGASPGTATITATSEGKSGTLVIRILAPVQSVVVTAPDSGGAPGHTVTASATLLDANGAPLTGRPYTWSSADASVATVDPSSGLITAVAGGATTITATVTAEGKSGNMPYTVTVIVDSVAVTPATQAMLAGDSFTFTATGYDPSGNPVAGATFSWAVSNGKATVTTAGVLTALDSGTVDVVASAAGAGGATVSGSATVSITLPPIGSVTFSPSPLNAKPGQQKSLTVTVLRAGTNAPLPGRLCSFVTSDPNLVTLDKASALTGANGTIGLVVTVSSFTAKGQTYTVNATCEGVPGAVTVNVT